jgi:hypothetical protein
MKKTQSSLSRKQASEDMQSEYVFDYSKARPNRFVDRMKESPLVVLVDPELAQVFNTPESVNKALRALIAAMPQVATRKGIAE